MPGRSDHVRPRGQVLVGGAGQQPGRAGPGGGAHPRHGDAPARSRERGAGPEAGAVRRDRLRRAGLVVAQEEREGERGAELRRQRCPLVARAEQPDLRPRGRDGQRRRPRCAGRHRRRPVGAGGGPQELQQPLDLGPIRPRVRGLGTAVQQRRPEPVVGVPPGDAQVDAARVERLQAAERLRHLEGAVVPQEDAGGAHPQAPGARRRRPDEQLRAAQRGGHRALVLRQPEAGVAEALRPLGQLQGVGHRLPLAAARGTLQQVEHGQLGRPAVPASTHPAPAPIRPHPDVRLRPQRLRRRAAIDRGRRRPAVPNRTRSRRPDAGERVALRVGDRGGAALGGAADIDLQASARAAHRARVRRQGREAPGVAGTGAAQPPRRPYRRPPRSPPDTAAATARLRGACRTARSARAPIRASRPPWRSCPRGRR